MVYKILQVIDDYTNDVDLVSKTPGYPNVSVVVGAVSDASMSHDGWLDVSVVVMDFHSIRKAIGWYYGISPDDIEII